MVSIITSLNNSVQKILMKTIEKSRQRSLLSIFAVAVFLLGFNTGFSQTSPTYTVCPGFPGLVLPAGNGGLTLNSANIPSLLGVTAVDPDGLETITYSASPSVITCADIGPGFSIAVTATDSDGSDVCNITVDIFDGGPFAICTDITVELDGTGNYILDAADEMALSAGSTACTGLTSITVSQSAFDCTDVGAPIQVTVIVEDANTATAFCLANITVEDNEDPTFTTCPADPAPVANAAGMCNAPVTVAMAVADDNCLGVVITNDFNGGGADASGTYPVGTTTVTFTATDASGNTNAATCSVDVVVNDTEAPVAACNNITVELDATGNYTLSAANLAALSSGSTDNCALTTTVSTTTFTCANIGANTVTVTVSDGTNSDNCMATITVEDNSAPAITNCPANATAVTSDGGTGDCAGDFSWTHPTVADNCTANLTMTYTLTGATIQAATAFTSASASGTIAFNTGVTTVTYTVSDGTNTGAPSCSFTVTVTDDEAPVVVNPGDMMVNNAASQCEQTVAWPTLTGSDNCPGSVTVAYDATDPKGNPLTILTAGANDFADFPVGISTVDYTVSDAGMPVNETTGSFTVTVFDNEAPSISCPAGTTFQYSSCNTMEMVPDYRGNASINDNCTGYTVVQIPAPGTLLSAVSTPANGETFMVTLTVTDVFPSATNLGSSCTFTITLDESDAPTPSTPGGILTQIDYTCGGPLTIPAPTATDACGNLICGEPFFTGTATNVGPACSNGGPGGTVNYASTGAVNLPDNNTGGANSSITVSDPNIVITDVNVNIEITHTWVGDLRATLTSPNGSVVELFDRPGTPPSTFGCAGNNLDVTMDDDAANTAADFENTCGNAPAISGSFQSIIPLALFNGENPNGSWTLNVSDNAGGDTGNITNWSLDIETSSTSTSITNYEFPNGNHAVTWVYDDGAGNVTNQLQQINVSDDVVLPVVSCQDITLELDGNGDASLVADDLQAPIGFTMSMTEDFGNNANNPGRVSMSVTATSNTTFTFDWDYENMDAGFEGLFYLVNGAGATANGTLIAAATGTGTTSVPLLAGDLFTVQILTPDNLFGESSNVEITNFNQGFSGDYSLGNWTFSEVGVLSSNMTVLDGDPSDDCTNLATLLPTLSASQTAFDCSDIGTPVAVTLSVMDEAGNIGSCTAMVTIVDELGPVLTQNPMTGSVADVTVDCDDIPAATPTFTADDNCDGALTVTMGESDTQSNNSASCAFYNYEITRTWSATDANSNTSTVTQLITVEDTTDPIVDGMLVTRNFTNGGTLSTDAVGCTATISLSLLGAIEDCAADADLTITNNSAFANAGGADASGDYPLGSHSISFTITDPCGNTSNWTESFTVVDGVAPVASCVNDLNLGLPASGILTLTATAVDNNSFDECSGVTLTVTPNTFTCADVGTPTMVTLTATDAAGNSSSCTTTVNIQDNNAPTALCTSATVSLDSDGNATITAGMIDNGSFDDCTAVTTTVSPSTFTEADLGNNTVTLTVMDENGNSTSCSANVTVTLPETCFNVGVASGGAGEVISLPVTSENFTALVGFQFELQLNNEDAGEFVGIDNINPDLSNIIQENLIVTDSFISQIDSMIIIGSMGQDSTVYDSLYTDNNDAMSISWNQFNTDGMGNLTPITFPDGTVLFTLEVMLTGNIGDFTIVSVNTGSGTTPPQVVYSFGGGFIPAPACVNQGAITIGQLIIAGEIYNESGNGINLVDVDLFQPPSPIAVEVDQTMADGVYDFTISAQGTFVIAPTKDINWSNGIDILDVSGIQRHSVGNPYVNSAYKKIAADVTGEGDITTFDAVILNSYLASLFMNTPPPTPSWQFVDAKQMIANDQNAFVPNFANTITLTNIMSDSIGNDFIAVKTGDLGGLVDADTLLLGGNPDTRTGNTLEFMIEDRALVSGDKITVDLTADNFEQMIAYQWILDFDEEVLTYTGFDNVNLANLGEIGFGEVIINEGKLVLTWYNGTDITKSPEEVLYSLNFEVKKDASHLSDLLSVTSHERMAPVAYNVAETPMDIDLIFTQPETKPSTFTLNQNTPNPFKDETAISFMLPEATEATLTIMDVTGRILKKYEGDFAQGYNEISVNRSELPQSGTLIYELKTPDHTASMKMIVID